MTSDIADVALELFEARGFATVTVEDVAAAAGISIRTFYRYFATKDDLLVVKIRRRAKAVASALADRPIDEPPLHSVRLAVETAISIEDPELIKRWIRVVTDAPGVLRTVTGAFSLEINGTIAEFFATRLGMSSDAVVPTTMAAAVGAVIQSAQTRWLFHGGDLVPAVSEALQVLEDGIGTDLGRVSRSRRRPKPDARRPA
jgi:AcrR family transcriptional regulator